VSGLPSSLASTRSAIAGADWPPVVVGPAANLAAMLAQLEETQWLAPPALAARQFAQLVEVAAWCRSHAPHLRRRMQDAGLGPADLGSPEGLRALPVLTRRDLQTAEGLYCDAVPKGQEPIGEARTSGATGEPVVVRRTALNLFDWRAFGVRRHLWHGVDPRLGFCAIRANVFELQRFDSWRGGISLLVDTGPFLAAPITLDVMAQIDLIAGFAPGVVMLYPSTLAAIVEACEAHGRALPSVRFVQTIGETLSPQTRAAAERCFGAAVADCYSSQELGYIGLQCPDAPGAYHVCETLIVEVLRPDGAPCVAGETGRVVVTDLRNFATPLIRYDTGDYAEVGAPCVCGRGLPTLTRILGRERNLIRMPDGTRHWPLVGFGQFREIAPVTQYQLIQQAPLRIEVRLVVERALTPAEEAGLGAHVKASLGHPFELRFSYFEGRLPVGANGKFEEFVSRLA
jgi:phenylacetate-CoA ligase